MLLSDAADLVDHVRAEVRLGSWIFVDPIIELYGQHQDVL